MVSLAGVEADLVVTCPPAKGSLRIEKGTVRGAAQRLLGRASAWVWEPNVWRRHPAELLEVTSKLGIGKLYITVPISRHQVLEPERL